MTYRNSILLLVSVCMTCLVATAQGDSPAREVAGYRGPGRNCTFPGSNPPIRFSDETGRNILWKAETANWSHAMPIVVKDTSTGAGQSKLLAVSEPGWKSDWPQLQCWDAETGKLLWQKEINHLQCLPAADRDALAAAYAKQWEYCREAFRAGRKGRKGKVPRYGTAKGVPKQMSKKLQDAGLEIDNWHWPSYGSKICCVGSAHATPVSDGRHVYVATGMNSFACFDLEGKQKWIRHSQGESHGSAHDFCKYGRSPLLYGDLLISDIGTLVRAFDKTTGKLLWSHPQKAHEVTSPTILQVDGKDILLVAGMKAYALPGGRPLTVDGWSNHGLVMVTNPDRPNVVFFSGGGQHGGWYGAKKHQPPAAVAFSLAGNVLKAKMLWSGIPGQRRGSGGLGLVYHDGVVYHMSGAMLDARTGTLLGYPRQRHHAGSVPETRHLIALVGDPSKGPAHARLIGSTGPAMVNNRARPSQLEQHYPTIRLDGWHMGSGGPVKNPPFEGETKEQWTATAGNAKYPVSYSGVFLPHGDRMYLRTADFVYCIGHATKDWPGDDTETLARLKTTMDVDAAGRHLSVDSPRRRLLALRAMERSGKLGGFVTTAKKLMEEDPYPEIRGAAAAALDAADPANKPGWSKLLAELKTIHEKRRGADHFAHHRRVNKVIAGMGEPGRKALTAELTGTKNRDVVRGLLFAAGQAGWVSPVITRVAREYVKKWKPGTGHDKHDGVGPAIYFCAAVEQGQQDVASLLYDHRYAGGDYGSANNRVQATLSFHAPAAIRLKWAKDCEGKTRTTNDGEIVRTDVPNLIQAMRGLGEMGPKAEIALPWLEELSKDKDAVVAAPAKWAVKRITGK